MSTPPRPGHVPLLQPLLLLVFLALATGLAWSHFLAMKGEGEAILEGREHPWHGGDFATAGMMWSLMMAGMMLPSAAPWIWNLARAWRGPGTSRGWLIPIAFLAGYLAAWTLFSLVAAALQGLLFAATRHLSGDFRPLLDGSVLILAGLYQWSSVKDRCLTHCRSPLGFFLTSWRPGPKGGVEMGFRHGLFCVGCCWLLMLLAFVVGIMNLLWMILLTVFVFIDHTLLTTRCVTRLAGLLLLGWGIWKWVA